MGCSPQGRKESDTTWRLNNRGCQLRALGREEPGQSPRYTEHVGAMPLPGRQLELKKKKGSVREL